jgi:hypothetical protein
MNHFIYFTLDPRVPDESLGIIENLKAMPTVYPRWKAKVITLSPIEQMLRDIIELQGAEIFEHPASHVVQSPSLVSFLYAAQSGPNHRFLIRSPYCRIGKREAAAVDQWLASNAQFHVIRDHPAEHDTPIVPHLWGAVHARVNTLPIKIVQTLESFFKGASREIFDPSTMVERVLAEVVWPRAKHWGVLRHDPHPRSFDTAGAPFPPHDADGQDQCGVVHVLEEPKEGGSDATEEGQEQEDAGGEHSGVDPIGETLGPGGGDSPQSAAPVEEEKPQVVVDSGKKLL